MKTDIKDELAIFWWAHSYTIDWQLQFMTKNHY